METHIEAAQFDFNSQPWPQPTPLHPQRPQQPPSGLAPTSDTHEYPSNKTRCCHVASWCLACNLIHRVGMLCTIQDSGNAQTLSWNSCPSRPGCMVDKWIYPTFTITQKWRTKPKFRRSNCGGVQTCLCMLFSLADMWVELLTVCHVLCSKFG